MATNPFTRTNRKIAQPDVPEPAPIPAGENEPSFWVEPDDGKPMVDGVTFENLTPREMHERRGRRMSEAQLAGLDALLQIEKRRQAVAALRRDTADLTRRTSQ